ncbi:MAG: type 4a pilus biogenesis protein PilO [Deltaproteobacteria bacterium]|nr:type 4a pilus biogenesis protein PilO [Deltaproteobacteria bacterium]
MAGPKKSAKELIGGLNPNSMILGVWVVAVLAIAVGYYFMFYDPLEQTRVAEEGRKAALTQQRTTEEANLRRYNSDVAALGRARQRAEELQRVLPTDADIPGFMRNINALAETAGLQIQLIQPVEERVELYYARIPVQIKVRGSYLSLTRFFYQVSRLQRVINMENIKLETPTEDPVTHEVLLAAETLATTFRSVVRPAAAARPATPRPAAGATPAPAGE